MKKTLMLILALTMFLTPTATYASGNESITIDSVKKEIKNMNDNGKTISLDGISPRGLNTNKKELSKAQNKVKLRGEIKRNAKSYKENEKIKVRVFKNYTVTNEEFENALKTLNNSLQYTKKTPHEYDLEVTPEQLDKLVSMDEVMIISSPEEAAKDFMTGYISDDGDSMNLNASSEMMGAKKAKVDFGVTGDLDGNETNYTKNDVVIAIIDSGIDTSHVDLDGGKVIGWFDAVNGEDEPYDDEGHGTHVASIAAGTGEGDPGIQEGFAPGAALVGVKVLDSNGDGTAARTEAGLQWIFDNIDTYSIDVVNMSIGTHASFADREDVINLINDISDAGVPVFVTAGNEGDKSPYYDTLSTYAKFTSTSVGSVKDPYEGGWGLSKFSSRGTGSETPYIVSCGENIRAAEANTTNEYISWSGTSMACPMVTGTFALMYDAAYTAGGGTISFSATDMGEAGTDKNYGGGRLLSYESIKNAGGLSGSFNTYRTYIVDQAGYVDQGSIVLYPIQCNSSDADLNITLIITDEGMEDLDLVIWEPGADPHAGDPSTYYINEEDDLPQESLSISSPEEGLYYICVWGRNDAADYTLEITGHEIQPQ